jgi:hypothetical protein
MRPSNHEKNNMKMKNILIAVIPMLALCNCASLVSKSDYPVAFQSSKSTKFTVKNQATNSTVYSGTTPATVTLSSSEGFFQAAKYDINTSNGTQRLSAGVNPWIIGNFFNFSGLIGFAIDGGTGAMWKLPSVYRLNS